MDYNNFKENFIEDVRKGLYERGIEDVNITTQQTTKLNESYESIAITPEGSNIGINTSLEMFFRAVEDGQDYNEVVQRAVNTFTDGIEQTPSIDVSSFFSSTIFFLFDIFVHKFDKNLYLYDYLKVFHQNPAFYIENLYR